MSTVIESCTCGGDGGGVRSFVRDSIIADFGETFWSSLRELSSFRRPGVDEGVDISLKESNAGYICVFAGPCDVAIKQGGIVSISFVVVFVSAVQ